MDMNPKDVLHILKEIKAQRELTSDEIQLGRIAARIYGQQIHQDAIAAQEAFNNAELKRLTARGYTPDEARATLAVEERTAMMNRGFGTRKRCSIGAPNRTTLYSPCDFLPLDNTPVATLIV